VTVAGGEYRRLNRNLCDEMDRRTRLDWSQRVGEVTRDMLAVMEVCTYC
jgi:hypothetical protein